MEAEIDRLIPPVSARDLRQGPDDAPVTLVEFGDTDRLEQLSQVHSDEYPVFSLYLDVRPQKNQEGRLISRVKS